jgi:hypothetical protein
LVEEEVDDFVCEIGQGLAIHKENGG